MALDNVVYVDDFPHTFTLQNKAKPNIDVIGIKNFVIHDSILILSTTNGNGLWSFLSLPDYQNLGSFINRGNGPLEFNSPPSVGNGVKLTKEKGKTQAYIYDFRKGRLLKMNVDESIKSKKLHMSISNDSLTPSLFDFVALDSLTYFCKEVANGQTQQIRYINKGNKKTKPPILEKLNQASIKKGEDINILSTITAHSDQHDLIVEMPIGLNYINLYALDGSFKKTVCMGEELDNIGRIQDKFRWNRMYTFADLRLFDDFFGVVYINEDEKTYQINREKFPSILLFNWEGEPLGELKLNTHITSFDIDFVNGKLYTFDVHSEDFFKYDITDILSELKK